MGRKWVTSLAVAIHSSFLKENKTQKYRENQEDNCNSQLHMIKLSYQQMSLSSQQKAELLKKRFLSFSMCDPESQQCNIFKLYITKAGNSPTM